MSYTDVTTGPESGSNSDTHVETLNLQYEKLAQSQSLSHVARRQIRLVVAYVVRCHLWTPA